MMGWREKREKKFVFNELGRVDGRGTEKRNGLQGFTSTLHEGFRKGGFRGLFFTSRVEFRGK